METDIASAKSDISTNSADISGNSSDITDLQTDKLNLSGGAMTGALTLSGAPTSNLHAATKAYVDDSITGQLIYQGGYNASSAPLTGS